MPMATRCAGSLENLRSNLRSTIGRTSSDHCHSYHSLRHIRDSSVWAHHVVPVYEHTPVGVSLHGASVNPVPGSRTFAVYVVFTILATDRDRHLFLLALKCECHVFIRVDRDSSQSRMWTRVELATSAVDRLRHKDDNQHHGYI